MAANRRHLKLFQVLILSLWLLGCSRPAWYEALQVEPASIGDVPTASRFGDAVLFGAQPSEADFPLLASMGVKTVLNLRTEEEMAGLGFDEESTAYQAGLHYLNIPIGREEPSEGTLELISSIIDDEARHPLFIHCASSNRVGYVWSVYRGKRNGLSLDQAIEEGRLAGMRSPILEAWARQEIAPTADPE